MLQMENINACYCYYLFLVEQVIVSLMKVYPAAVYFVPFNITCSYIYVLQLILIIMSSYKPLSLLFFIILTLHCYEMLSFGSSKNPFPCLDLLEVEFTISSTVHYHFFDFISSKSHLNCQVFISLNVNFFKFLIFFKCKFL